MKKKVNVKRLISRVIIWTVVIILTLSCLLPLINMIAISFSGSDAVAANEVGFWPKDFTVVTYKKLLEDAQFWRSFLISIGRVALGLLINMFFTVSMAYPLSKSKLRFPAREVYIKFVIFAMLFSGGIIPLFMVVSNLHLTNTIWSLVLPGAVPVFNVILLINFFKGVPESLDEAARIDGSGEFGTFNRIVMPIMKPAIAVQAIFTFVGSWNNYFIPALVITSKNKQTLPIMIATLRGADYMNFDMGKIYMMITIAIVPIIIVYLFLSKFIVEGVTLGGVKE